MCQVVTPSTASVPSITPPKVNIPTVSMRNVEGFTLVFPNSGDIPPAKHMINGTYPVSVNSSTRYTSASSDRPVPANIEYVMYHEIAGNFFQISKDEKITMTGSTTANNINGSNFYGGGSRFAYIDDVRNSVPGLTFTLENQS